MTILLATKAQYQKALDKARKLGMVARVRPAGEGLYTVPSNTDPSVRYTVEVTRGGEYRCNCIAAGRGLPCCHAAATWSRVMGERSMKAAARPGRSTAARAAIWGEEAYR